MGKRLAILAIADEAQAGIWRDFLRYATHVAAPTTKRDVQGLALPRCAHTLVSQLGGAPGMKICSWTRLDAARDAKPIESASSPLPRQRPSQYP